MTTYTSTGLTAPPQPGYGHGLAGNVKVAFSTVATPSTFTTTDTANMHDLPPGARVLYSILESTDLDSGSTITLNVGDTGSAARYFSASTVGQAGTSAVATATTGIGYANAAKTRVTIVPAAGPATTAGTITLIQLYVIEGVAS